MRGEWYGFSIMATDQKGDNFLIDTDGVGVSEKVEVEVKVVGCDWSVMDGDSKIPITRVTKNPDVIWQKTR